MRSTCQKLKSHATLLFFASVGLFAKYLQKVLPRGFLRVTFLPFTHTIYTLITRKSIKEATQREKLQIGFLQHTHPFFGERATYPQSKIIQASSPSISHCHTLRGDLCPNITCTFSKCKECFGACEALGICQKDPMRVGGCNRVYYGIRKA